MKQLTVKTESNIKFVIKELYRMVTDALLTQFQDMRMQYRRRMVYLKKKRELIDNLTEKQAETVYINNISKDMVRFDFDYNSNSKTKRPLLLREIKRQIFRQVRLEDIQKVVGGSS